jgi:hypothetical protein
MSKPPPVPTHLDAPRTNLLMRSGRWVNLYDPSPADIMLEDWVTGGVACGTLGRPDARRYRL